MVNPGTESYSSTLVGLKQVSLSRRFVIKDCYSSTLVGLKR